MLSTLYLIYLQDLLFSEVEETNKKINRRRWQNGLVCLVARHWLASFILGVTATSLLFGYLFQGDNGKFATRSLMLLSWKQVNGLPSIKLVPYSGCLGSQATIKLSEKVRAVQEENELLRHQIEAFKAEHGPKNGHPELSDSISFENEDAQSPGHLTLSASSNPCGDKVIVLLPNTFYCFFV